MKTYKTFEDCKMAHPDSLVYVKKFFGPDSFAPTKVDIDYVPAIPADHLVSMKEFLDNGLKLVKGDAYLNCNDKLIEINSNADCVAASTPSIGDKRRYIIKAKALELLVSHGIASIQSASGHIEPIEREPVEQVLRRLNTEIDRALQSTSLSNGMRECLKSVISQVDDELLIQEAYSLHCEFYGNDAADFCAFKDDVGGRSLWLHFAKKLQEQA